MDLLDSLRRARKEHWSDAIKWLIWSWLGGLLPIWGLLLFLLLFSQSITWDIFTQNGEFALYSAATLSASIYVITKEDRRGLVRQVRDILSGRGKWQGLKGIFPGQSVFLALFVALLLFSTLLFAGATFVHLPGVSLPLNKHVLQWASLTTFIITTIVSFLVAVLDSSVSAPSEEEFRTLAEAPADELSSRFDAVRKGRRNG